MRTLLPIKSVTVLCAAATLALTSPAPASATSASDSTAAACGRYRTVDLGTLGGSESYSTAMNDRGDVVGQSELADGSVHGFLWHRGVMTDLGLFFPGGINNRRQILGTRAGAPGGWLWRAGVFTPLSGRHGRVSSPIALNDRGEVLGTAPNAKGLDEVPVLWSKGRARSLPLTSVSGINNRGEVSGGLRQKSGGLHAAVWRRGRVTDLGAEAWDQADTRGINDKGWVLGYFYHFAPNENIPRLHGALWRNGKRTDLGSLGGWTDPQVINNRGAALVVSGSNLEDESARPALWRRGVLTDLTPLGVPGGDGFPASAEYVDLNDRGQIAGITPPPARHAVVWQRR
jgi:probable HAF family extracellular repeat protein